MKKKAFTFLILTIILILYIFVLYEYSSNRKPIFKGIYQNEKDVNGYLIYITIQPNDNSFVEYIDNREVDRGAYEKVENNIYTMKSNKQDFEIKLNDDNSFEVIIKKINNGKLIRVKNIGDIPTYFETIYNDEDEYKALLD